MITDQVLQDRIHELLYMGFVYEGHGRYVSPKYQFEYTTEKIQSFDAEQWVEELDYLYQALGNKL